LVNCILHKAFLWANKQAAGSHARVMQEAEDLIRRHQADVVIFGHSHIFCEKLVDGVLFLNPGSAGPRRFNLGRSFAVLHLSAKVRLACLQPLDIESAPSHP
jgi:uncharacterized protein